MTSSADGIPPTGPAVAKTVARELDPPARPTVPTYYDNDESHRVNILVAEDVPIAGATTYSTVTLHTVPNEVDGRDMRVEFIATGVSDSDVLAQVVSTAAFYVMKNGWKAEPGIIYADLMLEYDPATRLPHLWVTVPWRYPNLAQVQVTPELVVHWLQLIPISDAERAFAEEHGTEALFDHFAEREVVYFDLERPSSL